MEKKIFPAKVLSVDAVLGIVEAIVAVMGNLDEGDDIIHPGSFRKTLAERGREVLVLDAHRTDSVMAAVGVPLEMREVGRGELPADLLAQYPEANGGLYTRTQYLLDTPEGAGVFKRIVAGAIKKYSIGYDAIRGGTDYGKATRNGKEVTVRNLRELKLYEYSPVLFAMNTATMTVGVKAVASFQNLPLAARDAEWDAAAAAARVREWAGGADNTDWSQYAKAFLWHDAGNPDQPDSYKLGYADIVDGELTAIPAAVLATAGDVDAAGIPETDKERAKAQITRYYEKMATEFKDDSLASPFAKDDKEMGKHGPIQRLADVFTGAIHLTYTTMADRWLIDGIISHDERMLIGSLTGDALRIITDGMPADLATRECYFYYGGYAMMGAAGSDETKAGRVLSQRNISRITAAMEILREALADAGMVAGSDTPDESDDKTINDAPPDKGAASVMTAGNDGAGPDAPPTQATNALSQSLQLELERLGIEMALIEVVQA